MKVQKINLDESIFDNDYYNFEEIKPVENSTSYWDDSFDDDFSIGDIDFERLSKMEQVPLGPKAGETTGVADTLIALINDEWEAIRGYNEFIGMIKANLELNANSDFERMLPVINDIVNEENKHVGQLQELLKLISPNATSIEDGARESRSQMGFVDGKLPVQIMEQVQFTRNYTPSAQPTQDNTTPNQINEYCSLMDVDDDM